jgi:hypothetical protein
MRTRTRSPRTTIQASDRPDPEPSRSRAIRQLLKNYPNLKSLQAPFIEQQIDAVLAHYDLATWEKIEIKLTIAGLPGPERRHRGPPTRVPLNHQLQMAVLGHLFVLKDRLARLRRAYQLVVKSWEPARLRGRFDLELTLVDLQERWRFTSLTAVKRATLSTRPDLDRAARLELNVLYGWGTPRRSSRARGPSDPAGTANRQLKEAADWIRSTHADPVLQAREAQAARMMRDAQKSLKQSPQSKAKRLALEKAKGFARESRKLMEQEVQRIAREQYGIYQRSLAAYARKHHRHPPA